MNKRKLIDPILAPFIYFFARVLAKVRRIGLKHFPFIQKAITKAGIYPLHNHYYEPLIDVASLSEEELINRKLNGIDWHDIDQIKLLEGFTFQEELLNLARENKDCGFNFNNGNFEGGDADVWYSMIRLKKPKRIIEVGSGYSTLIALAAIKQNTSEDRNYKCELTCIEPFEMLWLENTEAHVIRNKVEDIDSKFFSQLGENDFLFIDSSHIIRPQGDVLHLYLKILPSLKKGVIVHIHDIFTPRDYPKEWLIDQMLFWNEQYLVEVILVSGGRWKILAGLNYLCHTHYAQLQKACAFLDANTQPGSFYIQCS